VATSRSQGDANQGRAKAQPRQRPKPEAKAEPKLSQGDESPSSQRPDESAAGSSRASSAAASRPFLVDPGQPFEPRSSAPADPTAAAPVELPPPIELGWTPDRAEYLLKGQGALTHAVIGVGETDWKWEPAELDAVAPPLANSLNQAFDGRLVPFAQYADAIGALMGLGAYIGRSRRERSLVLASRAPVEQPTTGQPAFTATDVDAGRREAVRATVPLSEPAQPPGDPAAENIEWRNT
jgi:hypothetical protein